MFLTNVSSDLGRLFIDVFCESIKHIPFIRKIPSMISMLGASILDTPQNGITKPAVSAESVVDDEAEKMKLLYQKLDGAIFRSDHILLETILKPFPKNVSQLLVNSFDEDGDNLPLHVCIQDQRWDSESMRILLKYGADPCLPNKLGHNFVHCIMLNSGFLILNSFLKAVPASVARKVMNSFDKDERIPLLYCAKIFDAIYYIDPLLKAGSNPFHTDKWGWNILHLAAAYNRPRVLEYFLNTAQDEVLKREVREQLLNARDNNKGHTPLALCCEFGSLPSAQLLLKAKADPWICDYSEKFPYEIAVGKHHTSVARLLLEEDPKLSGPHTRLIFGLIFGVELKPILHGKKMKWPGYYLEKAQNLVFRTLQKPFVQRKISSICSSEQFSELIEAFKEASSETPNLKEIAQKIREGKLVIFNAGWHEHAISLVFRDGYLIICNRGEASDDEEGNDRTFFVRKIEAGQVSEDLLKKALSFKNAHVNLAVKFFYEELPTALIASEDSFCEEVFAVQPKPIYVNICAFGAAKASLRAALALLTKDSEAARFISKVWATWYREQVLDYFQKRPSPFTDDFVRKTIRKGTKKLTTRKRFQLVKHLHKLKDHVVKKMPLDKILNEIESFFGASEREKLEACLPIICNKHSKKKTEHFSPLFGRSKLLSLEFSPTLKQEAIDLFIERIDPLGHFRKKMKKQ